MRGWLRRSPVLELKSWLHRRVGQIPGVDYTLVTCCGDENPDKLLPRWLSVRCYLQKAPRRTPR